MLNLFALSLICTLQFTFSAVSTTSTYVCSSIEPAGVNPNNEKYRTRPYVNGDKTFIGGKIEEWFGDTKNSTSPIVDTTTGERLVIGSLAQFKTADSMAAVDAAKAAWTYGQGIWPQMTAEERIHAMTKFIDELSIRRQEIIDVLSWEICKNTADAAAEFDRTITFIKSIISAYSTLISTTTNWESVGGITYHVRRQPIGIMLCLSPFNYPLNEAYAVLIPALLSGNVAIMKIPTIGGLAHILTMEAFISAFPPGVVSFVSGAGRETMPPIMRSGE